MEQNSKPRFTKNGNHYFINAEGNPTRRLGETLQSAVREFAQKHNGTCVMVDYPETSRDHALTTYNNPVTIPNVGLVQVREYDYV